MIVFFYAFCLIFLIFWILYKISTNNKKSDFSFFQFFLQNHSTQLYLFFKNVFCCVFFFFNFFFEFLHTTKTNKKNSFLIFSICLQDPNTHLCILFTNVTKLQMSCKNHNTHNYKWSFFLFFLFISFFLQHHTTQIHRFLSTFLQ